MKSPFRKLVRISVVLLVLVLLFNFFGYYINRIRSLENKELIEAINRSGHQQSLSQRIAKETVLLLNNPEDSTVSLKLSGPCDGDAKFEMPPIERPERLW